MTIIATVNELRTWVDSHVDPDLSWAETDWIVAVIMADNHPAWDDHSAWEHDWSSYFDQLPDLNEILGRGVDADKNT